MTDLRDRHRLEDAVADALSAHQAIQLLERRTDSFDELDFVVATSHVAQAEVELKAKWQRYAGWDRYRPDVPERELFILDELALRHLLRAGADSHLLILDWPNRRWVLFDIAQLALAPKGRTDRQLNRRQRVTKAKVLLDLRDGYPAGARASQAVDTLVRRIEETRAQWSQLGPWPGRPASA